MNRNVTNLTDVAEEILNKCTVNDPQYPNPDDSCYSVVFNYEFIEDIRDGKQNQEYVHAVVPMLNIITILFSGKMDYVTHVTTKLINSLTCRIPCYHNSYYRIAGNIGGH